MFYLNNNLPDENKYMQINLERILICPECQKELNMNDSTPSRVSETEALHYVATVTCPSCNKIYKTERGVIDLRTGITQKGEWDLTVFEKAYEKMDYCKDEHGWAKSGGYPKYVSDYRYKRVKGKVIEQLKPKNNDTILDVGCGMGHLLFNIIKEYPDIKINMAGIDPAMPNIYRFNQRIKEENKPNIIGILGEAESLPFKDNSFDSIITSEVIEHIPDKAKAIKEMYRVLKKDGHLFITTPAGPMVRFWERFFWFPQKIKRLFIPPKSDPNQKAVFDKPANKKQLRQYLTQAGFSIERFEQNAIMLHESYIQFFPNFLIRLMLIKAFILETYFKPLFNWAGLHYIIMAKKQNYAKGINKK